MQNDIIETAQSRREEWARVNGILPWESAPEWAQFATKHCGLWFWLEKPPISYVHDEMQVTGRCLQIDPVPKVLSSESLFRRPGASVAGGAMNRLMACGVSVPIASRAAFTPDPEAAALRMYSEIVESAYRRFGAKFEEVMCDAVE